MAGKCSWTWELYYVCLYQPWPRNNSHSRSEQQFSLAFSLFPWNTSSHLWEPWLLGDIAYLPSEARYQGQKNLECSTIPHTEASKTDEAKDAGANMKWLPAGQRWNSWSVRIGMWWIEIYKLSLNPWFNNKERIYTMGWPLEDDSNKLIVLEFGK